MLLPSYNSCEETYIVCAAAPVLMSLKTVYLYCAICFQRCEVAGAGGKDGCALIDAQREILYNQ